jgi:fumarate hydratase class I
MCAEGHRPICQDTGIVVAFVRIGMDVSWEGATMSIADMVNEGVRRAYLDPDNTLRASIVADPAGSRRTRRTTRRPSCTWTSSPATPST